MLAGHDTKLSITRRLLWTNNDTVYLILALGVDSPGSAISYIARLQNKRANGRDIQLKGTRLSNYSHASPSRRHFVHLHARHRLFSAIRELRSAATGDSKTSGRRGKS